MDRCSFSIFSVRRATVSVKMLVSGSGRNVGLLAQPRFRPRAGSMHVLCVSADRHSEHAHERVAIRGVFRLFGLSTGSNGIRVYD